MQKEIKKMLQNDTPFLVLQKRIVLADADYRQEVIEWMSVFTAERKRIKATVRGMAAIIGVSAAFLSDCALGRRVPNAEMRKRFFDGLLEAEKIQGSH